MNNLIPYDWKLEEDFKESKYYQSRYNINEYTNLIEEELRQIRKPQNG